ncbi:helix-turn-helix domain-containing protein [Allobaculum stercoricanis]|uniref:helix-turn-helix domain-containing protein n=1 Tax=Allobaculum stercoricanis TaxID=174709 RepID=UPI000363F425|nr:helix-turn-helix transcriptional regulator [Allobaculum stercoricanis]
MSKEFGERLLSLLQRQGTTQKELAKRINTTEATLSRYISGDREPKANVVANIATALHTTSDYLLGIEQDGFDYPRVERLLARNSANITVEQKRALINALFGEDQY